MSFPLSAKSQGTSRRLPVAHTRKGGSRDASSVRPQASTEDRSHEARLQAAIVRPDKGSDPYADVPCTD